MQDGTANQEIKRSLAAGGMNVHVSSQSSTRTDFERNRLPKDVVRASVCYYNTEEEVQTFVQAVHRLNSSLEMEEKSSHLEKA